MADHSSNPPHTADQEPKTDSSELLEGLDSDLLSKGSELFAALVKSGAKDKVPLVIEEMLRKAQEAEDVQGAGDSTRVSPSAVDSQITGFGVREVPVDLTEEPLAPVADSAYPGREVDVPEAWLQQDAIEEEGSVPDSHEATGEEAESVEYYYDYGYDEDGADADTHYYYGDDDQEVAEDDDDDHHSSPVPDEVAEAAATLENSPPAAVEEAADPINIADAGPVLSGFAPQPPAEAQKTAKAPSVPEAAESKVVNESPAIDAAEDVSSGEPEVAANQNEPEAPNMIWQGMPATTMPELPTPVAPQQEVTPQPDEAQNKDGESLVPSVDGDSASSGLGVPPAFGIFDPSDDIDTPPVDSVPGTFSVPAGEQKAKSFEPIAFKKPDFAFDEGAAPEPIDPAAGAIDSEDEGSLPAAKEENQSAAGTGFSEPDSAAESTPLDNSPSEFPPSGIAPKPFGGFGTTLPSPRAESDAPFQPRAFADSPTAPLGSPLNDNAPLEKPTEEAAPPVQPAESPLDQSSPLDSPDKGSFWERPEDDTVSELPPELPAEDTPSLEGESPEVDGAEGGFDPVALFKGNGDPPPESVEISTSDSLAQPEAPSIDPVELPVAKLPEVSVVENDIAPHVEESPALSIFEPNGPVSEPETEGLSAEGSTFAPVLFPAKGREIDEEKSAPVVTPVANPFEDSSDKDGGGAAAGFMETVGPDSAESKSPAPDVSAPALELGSAESGKKGKGGLLLGTVVGVGVAAAGAYFGWHILAKGTAGDQTSEGTGKSAEALQATGAEALDPQLEDGAAAAPLVDDRQVPSPPAVDSSEPSVPLTEIANDQGQGLGATAAPERPKPQSAGLSGVVENQPKPGALPVAVEGIGSPDDAIKAFLTAETWQERYKFVHPDEVSREEMKAFYEKHGDGPYPYLAFNHSASGKVPGTDFASHLYLLRPNKEADQFVVSMEQTAEGYRIDWRAFVQFGYSMLDSFASDPNAEPMSFYVAAKRSHYFGTGIPDVENMLCLRVISPVDATKEIYAFASAGSLAAVEIKEQFRWGRTYRPVVTLEWASAGGENYIRIKHIDRMSWRGEG